VGFGQGAGLPHGAMGGGQGGMDAPQLRSAKPRRRKAAADPREKLAGLLKRLRKANANGVNGHA
jgi:hypothetical protein